MVIQCKRYAASRPIPARDLRDPAGSRLHFKADVAMSVTTSRFTDQATQFAATNNIITVQWSAIFPHVLREQAVHEQRGRSCSRSVKGPAPTPDFTQAP
jgi:Restriction endonuclease